MTDLIERLRALADALDPSGKVLTHPGDSALQRAADYLRAQAEAQPVAKIERVAAGAIALFAPDGGPFNMSQYVGVALYAHPAPAAPQAEPIDPHMIVADDRFPDEQAEPKREPLSDERIAEIQRAAYERAAQECIETAAELRRCADGCTDGRYDWKADGALDCADAIRALGRQ